MKTLEHKQRNQTLRAKRVRSRMTGTATKPRLSVHVSNRHIIAQLIDDEKSQTLAYVSTVGTKLSGTMTERATSVGTEIAKKAKAAKITHVVFDRGSHLYHGRVHALAEAARAAGLEF